MKERLVAILLCIAVCGLVVLASVFGFCLLNAGTMGSEQHDEFLILLSNLAFLVSLPFVIATYWRD